MGITEHHLTQVQPDIAQHCVVHNQRQAESAGKARLHDNAQSLHLAVGQHAYRYIAAWWQTHLPHGMLLHAVSLPLELQPYLAKCLKDELLLVSGNATARVLYTQLHHVHANTRCWQGLHCHPDIALSGELQRIPQ